MFFSISYIKYLELRGRICVLKCIKMLQIIPLDLLLEIKQNCVLKVWSDRAST